MPYRGTIPSYTFSVPGFTRAVKVLVIVTCSVWVLQYLLPPPRLPWGWLYLFPVEVVHGAVWQLFSYLFLHAGFWHLFWNMFGLWMFGVAVEQALGTKQFYFFYFLCGVGAGLIDVLAHLALGTGQVPTIGASGAIFGVLLAFGMMFPDQPVFLLIPPVSIKAKWLVLGYGVLEFLFTLGASDGVSHFAHLGGMLFAFLYLRGASPLRGVRRDYERWRRRRLQRRFEVYMRKRDRHNDPPGENWMN